MKKLVLDVEALRVDTFEVQPERGGAGTVFARATLGCPPACSLVCAYDTQESCETRRDCPQCSMVCAYETQASCPPQSQGVGCPPPCSLVCAYETQASCP